MTRHLHIRRDSGRAERFLRGLVFLGVFCLFSAAPWQPARAQMSIIGGGGFSCSGATANGNLFSVDTITTSITDQNGTSTTPVSAPTGQTTTGSVPNPMASGGQCASTGASGLGIFGRLLCFFKSTIGQIISAMYCGFQYALQPYLKAILTLFITVYGILIATGMANFTVKDTMKAMFKVILVWLFATNATWAIGVGYQFFIFVAEQGSKMVLNAMNTATGQTASLTQPDAVLYSLFNFMTPNSNAAVPANLSISGYCGTGLATVLLGLLFTVPPLAIFLIIMVILYIGLYARAVLGYLTALVLISFLFVLSPLFVSLALFNITRPIFEQWIRYLITYSLQMVIVFAFLAMLEMVPVGTFFLNTVNLLREFDTTYTVFGIAFPVHTCGVCDPGTSIPTTANMLSTTSPLVCPTSPAATLPPGDALSSDGTTDVIPLLSLLSRTDFISFMVAQVIALWLIGYVMENFLKRAPDIAQEIGGLPTALVLGGKSAKGGPQLTYVGLQSIEAGFQGMKNRLAKDRFNPTPAAWVRRLFGATSGFADGLLHGALPDTAEARELENQGKDVALGVKTMQQKYEQARQLTLRNRQTVDALITEKASQAAINRAQKNYTLASGNEAQRKQDLINALKNKAETDKSTDEVKLPGLAESIEIDVFKALAPQSDDNNS